MTPWRLLVHLGLPDGPVRLPLYHKSLHLLDALNYIQSESFHEDTRLKRFLDFQPLLRISKEIVHLLVVNFQVGTPKEKLAFFVWPDYVHYMLESAGNDPLELLICWVADHAVSFAAACLSVGENGAIIPLDDILDQPEGRLVVYLYLSWLFAEDIIVGELFFLSIIC